MAKVDKKASKQRRSLTRDEKAQRIKAAEERQRREEQRRIAAQNTKKIFTIVICIILVLALGIPTMALTVLAA